MHKANLRLWICCLKLLKRVIMSFIFISETILYWSVTYIMPAGSVHWLPVNNVYFDSCQHHIKMEHLLLRQNIYSSTTYALSQEAVHFFMLIFYIYIFYLGLSFALKDTCLDCKSDLNHCINDFKSSPLKKCFISF